MSWFFDIKENICATYFPHLVKQSKIWDISTAEYVILLCCYHIMEVI